MFFSRLFTLETLNTDPGTIAMWKVGLDLDNAMRSGISDVFKDAYLLFCKQHLEKADERKLKSFGAN